MRSLIRNICLICSFLLACSNLCYSQIDSSATREEPPISLDYSSPKLYEVGGITSTGSANFDQRMLMFGVGDLIEIPGEKISKSIKKLWETGMFEDIDISVTRRLRDVVFLNVHLVERSRLAAFAFTGTKKNEENEIREKIKLSQGNIVNDNLKQTCTNIIKKYYVEKGFYNAEVNVEEKPDEKIRNAVNLVFHVEKNGRVKIQSINIISDHQVSNAKLYKAMKETKARSRFMPFYKADTVAKYMITHPDYYRSKDILEHCGDYFSDRVKLRIFKSSKFIRDSYEKDKIKLIEKYNEQGYRDAYIVRDSVYLKDGHVNIDIQVNEGHRY